MSFPEVSLELAAEAVEEARSDVEGYILDATGIEPVSLDSVSTDTLIDLARALVGAYEDGFSSGVMTGGGESFELGRILASMGFDVGPDGDEAPEDGDLSEADAIVVDQLSILVREEVIPRLEFVEAQTGYKWAPELAEEKAGEDEGRYELGAQ